MATIERTSRIERLLSELRRRIRRYTWQRGVAFALAYVGLAFWVALAIDWLFEPVWEVRLTILLVAGLGAGYVIYRLIVARAFVPLSDSSMAVVLERKFCSFQESLLTTVELSSHADTLADHTREMLAHTCEEADRRAAEVNLDTLFNLQPLRTAIALAAIALGSIVIFAQAEPELFQFGLERLATITDAPWPRKTRLEIEGFPSREAVVAKGGDLEVVVKADTMRVVPSGRDGVKIRYRTADGARERRTMVQEGIAQRGPGIYQRYVYVFQRVLSPIDFDVYGGDARLRNLHIRVVDHPAVTASLHCEFPKYMQQSPRDLPATAAMSLPRGTRITMHATANKDLVRARVDYTGADSKPRVEEIRLAEEGQPARQFECQLDALLADTTLSISLVDTDGISRKDALRISLSMTPDTAPQVNLRLAGIGSAITQRAQLPFVGEITDDHGLTRTWIETSINEAVATEHPFAAKPDGRVAMEVKEALEVEPLGVKPGQKLLVGTKAADTYDLPGVDQKTEGPNVGLGERFLLDVVTPEELRAILESRELNLRQRFEKIIEEMTETRESLDLVGDGAKPMQSSSDEKDSEADTPERHRERSRLRVERAVQNSEKNKLESDGVAVAFDGIREELVNNRVDTEELKIRLKDQIADPLHDIVKRLFPELEARLKALGTSLDGEASKLQAARAAAIAQADLVLLEMRKVQDRMLELETFNEALDLLRSIISAQQKVGEKTKKQRDENLRKLLE
jgi:uncharacterized membrane protein (DUF485 family)